MDGFRPRMGPDGREKPMARTLVEFHGIAADLLISAKRQYDGRPKPGETGYLDQDSQNATTVWRRTVHLISGYANGTAVRGVHPTPEAFWADGMDRAKFLKLVARRSRIVRAIVNGGDMEARLYDDSVRHWECGLARDVMHSAELIPAAWKTGNRETIRRIELDHEVTVNLAVAYTGVSLAEFRRIVNEREGESSMTAFAHESGKFPDHPMADLITANRPTF